MTSQTDSYVRFRNKWHSIHDVMRQCQEAGTTGLLPVPCGINFQRVALELLCLYYSKQYSHWDDPSFHSIPIHSPAKIMWVNGEAAAYYTYQIPGDFTRAQGALPLQAGAHWREQARPHLMQVYVRPEYRRQGLGKAMVHDFFRERSDVNLSDTKFSIESPVSPRMKVHMMYFGSRGVRRFFIMRH